MSANRRDPPDLAAAIDGGPFGQLQRVTRRSLLAIARIETLSEGQRLPDSGAVWLVQQGKLRLIQWRGNEREIGLLMFAPGDVFSLHMMAAGDRTLGTGMIEALQDSVLIAFTGDTFMEVLAAHHDLALLMLRLIVPQLHLAYRRIYELMVEQVEQRLARCVLRLARRFGSETATGLLIDVPLSRQHLADLAGTRFETVSRFLSSWERDGIVLCQPKRVWVLDMPRLEVKTARN